MSRRNPRMNIGQNNQEMAGMDSTSSQYSDVADWIKATSRLFVEMQDKTSGWFSTRIKDNYSKRISALYNQKDTWYSRFKGNEEAINAIDAVVEDLKKAQEVIEHNGTYYSQWRTREEYDNWYALYGADKGTRLKNATANLEAKTEAKNDAYRKYNSHLNAEVDDIDFMTYDSEAVEEQGQELLNRYQQTEAAEKKAKQILWDAKYDTMTATELQAVMERLQDKEEKDHVSKLHRKANLAERKQELEDLISVADPKAEQYDPDFLEKSAYHSTKLPEGEWGESDTGYADIDYEFINGNRDISELIVGLERNYYQISDEERRIYNYWHNYDREHGKNKAKRYLELIQETLNDRDSALDYSKFEGKALLEIAYGLKSGLSKFGNDVNNWYLQSEDYIPRTSTEMTAQRAYESLSDVGTFLKINGKTLGQLGFDVTEDVGYNLPSELVGGLVGQGSKVAGALVKGVFSGTAANGDAYRELINRGYTPEEAERYGDIIGFGTGAANSAEVLIQDFLKKGVEKLLPERVTDPLNKLLIEGDWLGISDAVQSKIKEYAQNSVGAAETQIEEKMRTTTQGVVTAKALDKILNQLHAGMSEVSPDLRQALLESLKDPDVRQIVEQNGSFTSAQLDKLIAELENAEEGDTGSGTYVGDILFGANGYSVNRQYLQPWVDTAIRQRGLYANDPTARAIYERYLPRR